MRGMDETSGSLFSYVDLEDRIPAKHPPASIPSSTGAHRSILRCFQKPKS